jgi:hypothetical protein
LVADGPQDDNTHGKKHESEEVHLEETRNHTAWDNQLKGCVTEMRNRRHGKRNRKSTEKQLITHFLWTLEAAFDPALDTDAHLDKSTIIFVIGKLQCCKTKQDSNTRPRQIYGIYFYFIAYEVKLNRWFISWMYIYDLVLGVKEDLRRCTIHYYN